MNRTLLLVVCDFLLLSLLALANFEQSGKPVVGEREGAQASEEIDLESDDAMIDLLASALSAEQEAQLALEEKLAQAEQNLSKVEENQSSLSKNLQEKEERLSQQEQELAEREALLAEARAQAEQIAKERATAETEAEAARAERDRLSAEAAAAQNEANELARTVETLSAQTATRDDELEQRSRELARLQASLAEREKRLREAELVAARSESERQRLAGEVQAAEREKRLLSTTLESARETIDTERREKEQLRQQTASLTEGVSRLAEASTEITEEVRNLRPKTSNEIYQSVNANRISISFEGARAGLFGENDFTGTVDTIITEIDGRAFAWVLIEQTPFADPERRKFINRLDAYLEINGSRFRIPQMGVLEQDNRLLFLPLAATILEGRGVETFKSSGDPFRFEDVVVIDLPESRFGESGFQIDTRNPGELEIDRRVFSALFGEFSPSPGDLAFTRTGAFLGIVTAPGKAWMASEVKTAQKINFGEKFSRALIEGLPE